MWNSPSRMISAIVLLATAGCETATTPVLPDAGLAAAAGSAAAEAPPSRVTVQFGNDDHGSPFPPPSGHDASGHARDKIYPRTVVLARGGSITFNVDLVHQVAVYDRGTEPSDIKVDPTTLEDVDLGPAGVIPDFRINDPTNRLALGGPQQLAPSTFTTPAGTFDEPGRYLVICTTVPHFVAFNMYAWVIVK